MSPCRDTIPGMFHGLPNTTGDAQAAGPAGAAPRSGAGLVRLETSTTRTPPALPEREERRVRDSHRRALRLFKSLSCTGDMHRIRTDARGRRLQGIFLTCTYREDVLWSPRHVSVMLDGINKWCRRRGIDPRYCWVAEQHKSGRIHYHAILFVPRGLMLPKPDKQGWWPHGMTKIERCRKQSVGYLIKYATKCQTVARPWPKGCRLHGHGGLDLHERQRRSWWVLPRYIREQVEPELRVRRAEGGGWMSPVTGEWWESWKPPLAVWEGCYAVADA